MPKIRAGALPIDVAVEIVARAKGSNPKLVDDLKKIADEYRARDRTFDAHKDRERIETQRVIFDNALNFASMEGSALVEAMVDRAMELLDGGQAEACDAILEFVPADAAKQALDEFFKEDAT